MRTLVLATSVAAFLGTVGLAAAQGSGEAESPSGVMEADTNAAIGIGLGGMAEDTSWANSRVYVLPPEVDVEVTGSVGSRNCVGDTMGAPICQETVEGEAR